MTDDLEDLLRRYQPSGPPSSLRARIVGGATDGRRTWPWAAAAAALLGATLALHAAREQLSESWTLERSQEHAFVIDLVADMLGGGDAARRLAEQAVMRDEAMAEVEAVTPVGTSGDDR